MSLPAPTPAFALPVPANRPLNAPTVSPGRPKFLPTHWPLASVRLRPLDRLPASTQPPSSLHWPGIAIKLIAVALCYALVGDAEAGEPLSVRYGEPQVLSALGEPVDIRIPIARGALNTDARFMLGQQDPALDLPVLRHASIQLEQDAGGWALRIRSNRRSTEPAMAVVVQEIVGSGIVSRTLPVLFDPVPTPIVAEVARPLPRETLEAPAARPLPGAPAIRPLQATATPRIAQANTSQPASRDSLALQQSFATQPPAPVRVEVRRAGPPYVPSAIPVRAAVHAPVLTATLNERLPVAGGLRLSHSLGSISPAAAPRALAASDRDTLRWLNRQMLGSDEGAGLASLSRQAAQLTAQVEQLENRLAGLRAPSVAHVTTEGRSAPLPNKGDAITARKADTTTANEGANGQPLRAQFAPVLATNQPWGLPLLAGLMLGAGYWSGRRGRPLQR